MLVTNCDANVVFFYSLYMHACEDLKNQQKLQVAVGELELNHEYNMMHWSPDDFESKLQVSIIGFGNVVTDTRIHYEIGKLLC